ncbi:MULTISPECIES: hypothetical protein [Capnocytophaga]|uniref:Uncharacterized protein n=1 Tax=Capnocytophaga granulosa TaxID=45242 RepID=A0A1H2QMR5_9FLAO|nr:MULTISPECIES: hypothetical protein [Capnocytophaga]RKW18176.1 MAG: hypothetical protein D8H93_02705 [Capnocytophaga sp.]EJU31529.1 hypothetical protein HMPREF1154_1712 [Capnocytophaga sp. CM59]EPD29769.1 hypothetical protein HMPREF9331_00398 [Capnocytophaga granulosa ATCC 51502]SDW07729.1 hypothetical protein SAMN05444420_101185 [Capnocytophaga granulosa]SUX22076.1 Uncharacterised protein [Capnocytophaga granulosa]
MSIVKKTNIVAYTLMIIGVLLLYLQSKKEYRFFQEQYVLMAGLILMVVGIYMLSKKLSSREHK